MGGGTKLDIVFSDKLRIAFCRNSTALAEYITFTRLHGKLSAGVQFADFGFVFLRELVRLILIVTQIRLQTARRRFRRIAYRLLCRQAFADQRIGAALRFFLAIIFFRPTFRPIYKTQPQTACLLFAVNFVVMPFEHRIERHIFSRKHHIAA